MDSLCLLVSKVIIKKLLRKQRSVRRKRKSLKSVFFQSQKKKRVVFKPLSISNPGKPGFLFDDSEYKTFEVLALRK